MPIADIASDRRWELYKLLGEPIRLRLLALSAVEELAIGELAELCGESQPNVSRHLKPLRRAGLLVERKEGTRVYVRLDEARGLDPVIEDALRTGHELIAADGSAARVAEIIAARELPSQDFFERGHADLAQYPSELSAYLSALRPLMGRLQNAALAVDAGCGNGAMLEVIAPIFEKVLAFDRSEAQVGLARQRMSGSGYSHVQTMVATLGDASVEQKVHELGGADVVFAARLLHHASRPAKAIRDLSALVAPGGALVVVDYAAHHDETMQREQADIWLGFNADELVRFSEEAGLEDASVQRVPSLRCGNGPDGHLDWLTLCASKTASASKTARIGKRRPSRHTN